MATTYVDAIAEARATDERLVVVERDGAHAIVRMDDPDKLNPLSAELTVQLHDALRELARDEEVKAIVLTGTDPAFSAGGDLRLMRDMAHPMVDEGPGGATSAWRWIRMEFGGIARLITRTDKAFIAAVNGAAAGVGLAFALACDVILVSERAQVVPAFGRIGLVPEVGTSWLLTRRLGYQRTFELFAGGRILSGAEAHEIGLANAVVPHERLLPAALEWCERVEALPPHVVPMMKPLLRGAADMTWDQAIAMEEFAEPMCFTTTAHREAVAELLSASTDSLARVRRALALLTVTLAVAGCGDGDSDGFREDYESANAQLNDLGAEVQEALQAAESKSDRQLATQFDGLAADLARIQETISGLDPPSDVEDELDKLDAAIDGVEESLRQIADAARTGDPDTARAATFALIKRGQRLDKAQTAVTAEAAE